MMDIVKTHLLDELLIICPKPLIGVGQDLHKNKEDLLNK